MRGRFFFSGGGLVGLGTTGQLLRSGWFCPLKLLEKERSAAVRFTRLIQGGVEAGPKTVLALAPPGRPQNRSQPAGFGRGCRVCRVLEILGLTGRVIFARLGAA